MTGAEMKEVRLEALARLQALRETMLASSNELEALEKLYASAGYKMATYQLKRGNEDSASALLRVVQAISQIEADHITDAAWEQASKVLAVIQ